MPIQGFRVRDLFLSSFELRPNIDSKPTLPLWRSLGDCNWTIAILVCLGLSGLLTPMEVLTMQDLNVFLQTTGGYAWPSKERGILNVSVCKRICSAFRCPAQIMCHRPCIAVL